MEFQLLILDVRNLCIFIRVSWNPSCDSVPTLIAQQKTVALICTISPTECNHIWNWCCYCFMADTVIVPKCIRPFPTFTLLETNLSPSELVGKTSFLLHSWDIFAFMERNSPEITSKIPPNPRKIPFHLAGVIKLPMLGESNNRNLW